LGLDGGGTQTRAQIVDREGRMLGVGEGGPCSLSAMPSADAVSSIRAAVQAALTETASGMEEIGAVCAGVAGYSVAGRRAELLAHLQALFPRAQVSIEPDYAVALSGATGGAPGIIVIAGTGSVAYGEDVQGRTHRCGAYGYLIDDAGSGYGVGRAALAAVLRAADGTGEPTSLTERVCAALGLADVSEVVPGVYGGGIGRVAIASLSRVVAEAASEDGDDMGTAILMRAGGALAQLAHGVSARLFTDGDTFPIVPIGGLWSSGPALADVFSRSVRRFAPQALIELPKQAPVCGAAIRARRRLFPEKS
jgi:N-acetylglucosamine kinase-like BadF-type ATPase